MTHLLAEQKNDCSTKCGLHTRSEEMNVCSVSGYAHMCAFQSIINLSLPLVPNRFQP